MKTIVIASNNAHKAEEIATALAFPGWEFRTLRELGLDSDPAEDADSFEGNARIKAQAARAASDEDGTETVARGTIEGRIGREERGRHGFGYDPLFLPDMFEDGRTLAEALPEEKNAVSHRGNALRQLRAKLAQGER